MWYCIVRIADGFILSTMNLYKPGLLAQWDNEVWTWARGASYRTAQTAAMTKAAMKRGRARADKEIYD